MPGQLSRLGRLWAHEKSSYGLRVSTALAAAIAYGWYGGQIGAIPGLFLGIIASAIAETDDNWWGRSKAVALSLACFAVAGAAVVTLFPYPVLLITGLALAAFALTLLGALGERYGSIGQATVTLALYAMIALDQLSANTAPALAWREVGHLLAGAAGYGLLSIVWTALFANRPVREALARLYGELGHYLRLKAAMFEPVHDADHAAMQLALAEQNGRVVAALNTAKNAILARFGRSGRPGVRSGLYLRLYYMAQDFHERASSSHYPYAALSAAFFHSDVLYRANRVLVLEGKACQALGEAVRLRQAYTHAPRLAAALDDLDGALDWLHTRNNPQWTPLLGALRLLRRNLGAIERQLAAANLNDSTLDGMDTRLRDSNPRTLLEMGRRLRQQLTPTSVLFRHGVRIALALVAGYALMHLLNAANGYWILLTTVFVCRPHFGATRLRLVQRIVGTVAGLLATWALLQLFPAMPGQLLIAFAGALLFFICRNDRYIAATAGITLMALTCFNLLGDGFVLIGARLLDTVIGCVIAAAASLWILPDWQGRRLHAVMGNVAATASRYLEQVLLQYRDGKRDDLPWRIARRDMHNADAALSVALGNMLREPPRVRPNLDAGFRFLALSNTLLGHLSALGAHREQLPELAQDQAALAAGQYIHQALAGIAQALASRQALPAAQGDERAMAQALEEDSSTLDERLGLIHTQLALVLRLLPRLRQAAGAAAGLSTLLPPPTPQPAVAGQ